MKAEDEVATEDTEFENRIADLTFKARALAQAHPLTITADTYRQRMIDVERETQPLPEFAEWAATAFLVGYCVRRIEEADVDEMPDTSAVDAKANLAELGAIKTTTDELGLKANEFSASIRTGGAAGEQLLPLDLVEAVLDKVIATEVDKRAEHWRAQITKQDWAQFEEYVAWWVVHGYSLRAAEILRLVK